MLQLDIPEQKFFNDRTNEFITIPGSHLEMEHSLMSIRKWESKWHIPFLERKDMKPEEFLDYCRCMTINKPKNPDIYQYFRKKDLKKIADYMNDPMSARILRKRRNEAKGRSRKVITFEYYYFAMSQFGIPYECDKWHFGQLLALLDTFESNNSSDSPAMNYRQRQQLYRELNTQRRSEWHTKG